MLIVGSVLILCYFIAVNKVVLVVVTNLKLLIRSGCNLVPHPKDWPVFLSFSGTYNAYFRLMARYYYYSRLLILSTSLY